MVDEAVMQLKPRANTRRPNARQIIHDMRPNWPLLQPFKSVHQLYCAEFGSQGLNCSASCVSGERRAQQARIVNAFASTLQKKCSASNLIFDASSESKYKNGHKCIKLMLGRMCALIDASFKPDAWRTQILLELQRANLQPVKAIPTTFPHG